MPVPVMRRIALASHPSTPGSTVQGVEVCAASPRAGVLELRYRLHADLSRIRLISSEGSPDGRADGLWKHTCFEAFVRPAGAESYRELNFSPAKQWAAYQFDAYRAGMRPLELAQPPAISVRRAPQLLELYATVALQGECGQALLALTAVVEEDSGSLCYWSARHPAGKPDFHHPDGFVFELEV
jgi:hypothetical protein